MALTVLNVAYPLAQVGPDAVGGAEQILSALDRALVAAGHRSLVVAGEGSTVAGELVATPAPPDLLDDAAMREARANHRLAIEHVLAREAVDVVHLHGVDFADYCPDRGPLVATLHLPPDWYPRRVFDDVAPRGLRLVCVSDAQRAVCPPTSRVVEVVPNGVDLDHFAPGDERSDLVVSLGRVCPEKGFHLALDAARARDVPFVLGGKLFPYETHLAYFRDHVVPRLDDRRRFVGPLGREEKRRLLQRARCLVVPSLVAETSSLVAMEALASGTPVVALRRGALPEIVEHGRTGLVVEPEELARALDDVDTIDRAECRRRALERFSEERLCARYLELYARIADE